MIYDFIDREPLYEMDDISYLRASSDGKKAAFNSEAGVRALEFYGWFLKNGLVEPADVLSPSSGAVYDESFLKGKFVISLGNGEWLGTWTIYDIGMPLEDFNNTFDAAIIPAPASGGEPGACVAGGYDHPSAYCTSASRRTSSRK